MYIIVNRVLRGFVRRLKEGADINIKADVSKSSRNHFRTAIVPVLAHLNNQKTRAAALFFSKRFNTFLDRCEPCIALIGRAIDACECLYFCTVAAKLFFHRHADLSHCGPCAGGFNRSFQEVTPFFCTACQLGQSRHASRFVAAGADALKTFHLIFPHSHVVNIKNVDRVFLGEAVFVHPDNHFLSTVNHRLTARSTFLNTKLRHTAGDRFGHAAHLFDFFHQGPGFVRKLACQALNIIRTRQRIDDIGDPCLFLQNQLGVAGNARTKLGWQSNRLVKCIGVQALSAAQCRRHRLICRTNDIVVRVLLLQTDTRSLAMGA